jgi:hypothetical protein
MVHEVSCHSPIQSSWLCALCQDRHFVRTAIFKSSMAGSIKSKKWPLDPLSSQWSLVAQQHPPDSLPTAGQPTLAKARSRQATSKAHACDWYVPISFFVSIRPSKPVFGGAIRSAIAPCGPSLKAGASVDRRRRSCCPPGMDPGNSRRRDRRTSPYIAPWSQSCRSAFPK